MHTLPQEIYFSIETDFSWIFFLVWNKFTIKLNNQVVSIGSLINVKYLLFSYENNMPSSTISYDSDCG